MEKTRRSKFTLHGKIAKALQAAAFFAQPYQSWERGTNEHTTGLVRQYSPKKTGFATITQRDRRRARKSSRTVKRGRLWQMVGQKIFINERGF